MFNAQLTIKKILVFVVLLVIMNWSLGIDPVFAHLIGQPPYFKINGVYTNLYPVPTTSLDDFNLPQDTAPSNYLIGENINFEMDFSMLPAPPEVVNKTEFFWHYGDGSNATGLKNTYKYQKIGSYIFSMDAKYETLEPQFLQSVLINILPDKNYQLPTVKIIANGQEVKDPLTDVLKYDFKYPMTLEVKTNRDDIQEYIWDFGDGQKGTGSTVTHKYETGLNQVFPVVRVKTNDGFIADDYLQINNQKGVRQSFSPVSKSSFLNLKTGLIGVVILISLVICGVIYKRIKR